MTNSFSHDIFTAKAAAASHEIVATSDLKFSAALNLPCCSNHAILESFSASLSHGKIAKECVLDLCRADTPRHLGPSGERLEEKACA